MFNPGAAVLSGYTIPTFSNVRGFATEADLIDEIKKSFVQQCGNPVIGKLFAS